MNKQLNFGNSKGLVINDINIKNKIIDNLFNSIDLSKFRYKILKDMNNLNFLKNNPHFITPNYKGLNYYLFFTEINNRNYCVAIDKRKLSYHKDKVDIKNTFIIRFKIDVKNTIYKGTLFDTKLIRKEYDYIMLIKDCYLLMGSSLLHMDMLTKAKHINNILNNQFSKNCCNNFKIKINKFYDYNNLENLIKNIIPSCALECQGLIFYPKFSGINIIYIDKKKDKIDISNNSSVEIKSCNLISNLEDFLMNRQYSYELEGKKKKLWLEKTSITDVYNVYEKKENDKIGIAAIPNLKISLLCQNEVNDEPILFTCVYNKKFKKWIPIKRIK